ncbi:MAG: hypothetical protein M1819_005420 [Sarea resinae]|nr:MAG: hypothetical protein M1819_005420 [Sarea resinae]
MSSQTFNVAVIGYGMSAKVFHIPLILATPAFKLHAIVQRSPKPDDDAEKDHAGVKGYRSAEEMVKNSAVDVVVVTTTPESHFYLAKLALEAGKNVIVEKPFTPTHQEAQELSALAKKNHRLLTVYQNRRWDSDFVTLSHLIKSNTLGRVAEFETHFDRHRPEVPSGGSWKTKVMPGGGAVFDLGTHLIDQVVVTFGLPKKITGFVGSQREGDTGGFEDSCTVLLHYDQLMATVKAAVVSPEVAQLRYWVRGDKGSFKKFHLDVQEDQLKAGMKPGDAGFAIESEDHFGTLTTIQDGKPVSKVFPTAHPPTYVEFYQRFADALRGKGEVPVKPEEAGAVIRLIELAKESSKTGRTLDV